MSGNFEIYTNNMTGNDGDSLVTDIDIKNIRIDDTN